MTESFTCPNNCFDHGNCDHGECVCYPNYGGENCEYEFRRLHPGMDLLGEVSLSSWDYFNVEVHEVGSDVVFTVNELAISGTSSDCDMYLGYEKIPTRWDWDYANVTLGESSSIVISSSEEGIYVLGVYGYTSCSFSVSVVITSDASSCPDECSDHGSCLAGECNCSPGFEGLSCDWMNSPLVLDRPQTGYVAKNGWNYYHARAITESLLVISLEQNGDGDCDLYVKADEKPNRFTFDYVDLSLDDSMSITISEPGDHTWFIGVFGWEACRYSIVLDEVKSCECGENNPHGECREGYSECFCSVGWTGDDSSQPQTALENGVSSSVRPHEWKYYQLPANTTTTGVVSLNEITNVGLLWLSVSYTDTPSLSSFDLIDNQPSETHEISIGLPQSTGRSLFIGVYGSPYNTHDDEIPFELIAWGAPF